MKDTPKEHNINRLIEKTLDGATSVNIRAVKKYEGFEEKKKFMIINHLK